MDSYRVIAIQNEMEPYRAIKSHAGQYRTMQADIKLFRIILSHTGLYESYRKI